jgi:hypothetical protein
MKMNEIEEIGMDFDKFYMGHLQRLENMILD